jgi:hypothetical protein
MSVTSWDTTSFTTERFQCIVFVVLRQLHYHCNGKNSMKIMFLDIIILNQIDKWKQTYSLCLVKLQFQISREKI